MWSTVLWCWYMFIYVYMNVNIWYSWELYDHMMICIYTDIYTWFMFVLDMRIVFDMNSELDAADLVKYVSGVRFSRTKTRFWLETSVWTKLMAKAIIDASVRRLTPFRACNQRFNVIKFDSNFSDFCVIWFLWLDHDVYDMVLSNYMI